MEQHVDNTHTPNGATAPVTSYGAGGGQRLLAAIDD